MNTRIVAISIVSLCAVALLFAGSAAAQAKPPAAARVELNKATTEQLARCQGLSPALARAILEYRQKSGPFKSPQDLLKVKGMTQGILDRLKPTVEKNIIYVTPSAPSLDEDEEEPSLKPSKC